MAWAEDPYFNIILRIRELMRRDWMYEVILVGMYFTSNVNFSFVNQISRVSVNMERKTKKEKLNCIVGILNHKRHIMIMTMMTFY